MLAVFDGSDALDENDLRVIRCCKDAVCIALVNKNDLPQRLDMEVIRENFAHVVTLSAKSAEGADALKKKIEELFLLERFDPSAAVVANERQRAAVADARRRCARRRTRWKRASPTTRCASASSARWTRCSR